MKILVIEDNVTIIESISIGLDVSWPDAQLLSTHLGREGVDLVEKEKPTVVILDIGLPDIDGFEVLRSIRSFSEVPVIILTVNQDEIDVVKGLSLGADDYIVKPFHLLELMARIKTILKRIGVAQNSILFYEKLHLDAIHSKLSYMNQSIQLTPTENRIMQSLINNPGKMRSFDDLADEIWGCDYVGSNDAIRVYIGRLRRKVELISANRIHINSLPGRGFILETTT
ncbi:MAG: response regulator transcription factor [Dehalococcoidales bacterium]|jgi:two-component system KDP operon response regulator KdpE|nr:response regulator transcription factor [Dehalococcoidales bacterium]MDX9986189.1 response regulator transcription factor [Dehalococcoidales bacterium]